MTTRSDRTTRAVFDDHLALRKQGETETDIERNYAPDVVLLTGDGIHHGHDGVRETASILKHFMPNGTWEYRNQPVEGDYAFLEWTARTPDGREVCDGADLFVIRDGRIAFQSIHYTVHGDES